MSISAKTQPASQVSYPGMYGGSHSSMADLIARSNTRSAMKSESFPDKSIKAICTASPTRLAIEKPVVCQRLVRFMLKILSNHELHLVIALACDVSWVLGSLGVPYSGFYHAT
jgi:hypothetical protein